MIDWEEIIRTESTEELKEYLLSHESEVRGLDEESRFLLTTMIKEKRLKKQFLKKAEPKEKEVDDMCEAIQGMIDEGKEEGCRNERYFY